MKKVPFFVSHLLIKSSVDHFQRLSDRSLAQIPLFGGVESAERLDQRREIDVIVVVEMAEPPARRRGERNGR